jgi:hypothetical protein
VQVNEYNNSGNINWKSTIEIIKADAGIKIPSYLWTIAGLDAPIGAEVTDLRNQKLIGYWDGKRLIQYTDRKSHQQPKVPRMLLIGVITVVFIAPLLVILVRKFRKAM